MHETVRRWHDARDHDACFREQAEQALTEADNPEMVRIPHERVLSSWHQQRAELERRAASGTA